MSDLISRQAAIKELRNAENYAFNAYYKGLVRAHKIVAELPSVQPDQIDNNKINLCDSCSYKYPECSVKKQDAMFGDGKGNDNICACNKYSPVTTERKKGKWLIYVISMLDGEGCKCSECETEGAPYWNFCPNCGAEIDGGE